MLNLAVIISKEANRLKSLIFRQVYTSLGILGISALNQLPLGTSARVSEPFAMASPDDLKFQEFEEATDLLSADPGATTLSVSNPNTAPATGEVKLDLSEDEDDQEENSELLGKEKPTGGFWTFEYYQSFFDVDTMQVLDRIKGSVMPLPGRNFIKHNIRNNPDLYGPFWICATLVFSVAISGNLSTFLSQLGNPAYHYTPQFHRVTIAAVVVFVYAWLVPLCLWGFLLWRKGTERQTGSYSFLETVCVYGYSLFIYIPTSVLWIIPFPWLQWILILVAMVISGSLLVMTFWPAVRDDTKLTAFATVITIVLLHALLAIGCKMYFFQTAELISPPTSTPPTVNHTAPLTSAGKTH
ncbi:hypothetical protein GJAV_G00222330 [Gymnothorax javanicus]|nr:hypothetical protein GJAV_G00222330 [Gymnothorax javanicus]